MAAHQQARALLLHVDPRLGLREPDFVALAEFGAFVGGPSARAGHAGAEDAGARGGDGERAGRST